jgi:hypothetical protein
LVDVLYVHVISGGEELGEVVEEKQTMLGCSNIANVT